MLDWPQTLCLGGTPVLAPRYLTCPPKPGPRLVRVSSAMRVPQKLDHRSCEPSGVSCRSNPAALGKFPGQQVPQGRVRPGRIVLMRPGCDLALSVLQAQEPIHVQALITVPAVNAFDVALSPDFPGRLKSSVTPCVYAQRSSAFETNSGPLSTRIRCSVPWIATMRSNTAATCGTRRCCPPRWPNALACSHRRWSTPGSATCRRAHPRRSSCSSRRSAAAPAAPLH